MSRHYKKNSYSPVNRTQHIGAQRAEHEISKETKQIRRGFRELPRRFRERKGWKCDECGIVLKDNHEMLRTHFAQVLCIGCHAEQPSKNYRKLRERRTYKRFMERYGKDWCSRRGELKK